MNCPKCESADCKSVSMVHAAGTRTGSVFGAGLGMGVEINLGTGVVSSQSALARRLQPPAQPNAIGALLCTAVAAVAGIGGAMLLIHDRSSLRVGIIAVLLGMIFALCAAGFFAHHAGRVRDFRARLARWNRQWVCMACGHVWIPDAPRSAAIEFDCPACGQLLFAGHADAGISGRCASCGAAISVPAA